jgi:hypothetical protein
MKSDTSKHTLELFYKEIDKKFWEKVHKEKELYFKNKKGR